jgi:hypothetical protein
MLLPELLEFKAAEADAANSGGGRILTQVRTDCLIEAVLAQPEHAGGAFYGERDRSHGFRILTE